MDKSMIVRLLKEQTQKLLGKLASYSKYNSELEADAEIEISLLTINGLFEELKKIIRGDK